MKSFFLTLLTVVFISLPAQAEPNAELLFQNNCRVCHGELGQGDGPASSALAVPPRDLTKRPYKFGCGPGAVAHTITTGIPESGMPSFEGKLTEEEVWSLAEYVRSLQGACCQP